MAAGWNRHSPGSTEQTQPWQHRADASAWLLGSTACGTSHQVTSLLCASPNFSYFVLSTANGPRHNALSSDCLLPTTVTGLHASFSPLRPSPSGQKETKGLKHRATSKQLTDRNNNIISLLCERDLHWRPWHSHSHVPGIVLRPWAYSCNTSTPENQSKTKDTSS